MASAPPSLSVAPELLAPAGSPAALNAALAAGADAIYVGFGAFNARRCAENFTDETFADAARRAHLAGARVYVTMNVVIKGDEMHRALALARRAWVLGADALIVQDWGLLAEVRRRWPQVECHMSTQAAIMDARGVAFCHERGACRVTLARELSLSEIAACAREGVELEGFGHGALCFCYSGLCLMSSIGGARSANRGLCAQPCRLPMELVDTQGRRVAAPGRDRPLCPRDYRTIDDLGDMAVAGLSSIKLEGRMKAPEYVHAVVSAYRAALDERFGRRCDGTPAPAPALSREQRNRMLRRAFNRDFTNGYLFGRSGDEMMSYERSNNRGELVGNVVGGQSLGTSRVLRGGRDGGRERFRTITRAEVDVSLAAPVGKGDLLEVRPEHDPSQFVTAPAPRDAGAGEVLTLSTTRVMPPGSPVRVIRSQAALDAATAVRGAAPRLRAVRVGVEAWQGRPLSLTIATVDGVASVTVTGPVVEAARTRAVTAEELAVHATRLGGTPFEAASVSVQVGEGVGLPFSWVHKARAHAVAQLTDSLLAPYAHRDGELAQAPRAADVASQLRFLRGRAERRGSMRTGDATSGQTSPQRGDVRPGDGPEVEVCVLASDPAVAAEASRAGVSRIYAVPSLASALDEVGPETPVVPWLDGVRREADVATDSLVRAGMPVAVGNVSHLLLATRVGALPEVGPTIPVHNASALLALEEAGAVGVWLSGELTLKEVCALSRVARVGVGLVVFGRALAMTSEHCVLMAARRCVHDCGHCDLRRNHHFLRNAKGDLLPVTTGLDGRSRVWAPRPLDATPQLAELLTAGVSRLMIDTRAMEAREVAPAVRHVLSAVCDARAGGRPPEAVEGSTSGHLLRGID